MLKRITYYLLSVVFVAGMVACGGKSHDHLDHDHDHEHAEETEHHDHDSEAVSYTHLTLPTNREV